jgi:predicted nucleic acid-binding protein
MRLILGSNTLSCLLKEREPVVSRFASAIAGSAEFFLVPMVDHEVSRYLMLKDSKKLLRRMEQLRAVWTPAPFGIEEWNAASELWAERHRVGMAISDFDLLIAMACWRVGATLVTANAIHFDGLEIPLLDWTLPPD